MSQPENYWLGSYGRWGGGRIVGAVGIAILVAITINTALTKPNGATGIPPGQRLAPFAVPLALSDLQGEANVATHRNDGSAGSTPACTVRGARILNICQLDERGPVVLALFVNSGSCAGVLGDMQRLAPSFPGVRFAAVAIKGDRGQLRRLVRSRGLTFPVGIDKDGALVVLYKIASCPQVTFAYPGGVVQSKALLARPPIATLRARIGELVAAARARGWRGSA
ncbi:MAG TPA: hypothetical protein VNR42_06310 [Solirubrobacteraceae bacterium]|nr:hypothetical protein [Solirubrobacteraceae bacterium]